MKKSNLLLVAVKLLLSNFYLNGIEVLSIRENELERGTLEDALGITKASFCIETSVSNKKNQLIGVLFRDGKLVLEAESINFKNKKNAIEYLNNEHDFYIFNSLYFFPHDSSDSKMVLDMSIYCIDNRSVGNEEFLDFYKIYCHLENGTKHSHDAYAMIPKYKFTGSYIGVIKEFFRTEKHIKPVLYMASEEFVQDEKNSIESWLKEVEGAIIVFYLVDDFKALLDYLHSSYQINRHYEYINQNDEEEPF